jgi:two-component system, OmpR family, sensor kinase
MIPPRLALRFALVGLAQMATIAAGFWVILEANRPQPRGPLDEEARFVAARIEPELRSPDRLALPAALHRARDEHTILTVTDETGATVASTDETAPRCEGPTPRPPDADTARRPNAGPHFFWCTTTPVTLPAGEGKLHYLTTPPLRPSAFGARIVPLVLLVVATSSLLLAWSLVRPLRKLASAARAFGEGDRGARADVRRPDEIGDVARAFDDMADRVTQLLRSEKELLANISHELRTPLARIRVAVDLATEGDATVAREALVDIAEDLDELERLLSDVLTAARLDLADEPSKVAGLPPLRLSSVDLHDIVRLAASRFRTAHPARVLELDLDHPDHPATLEGDPVLLRRAVDNLLENAEKYTENPEAPIVLRTLRTDRNLRIEIIDQGIGIAPTDLPNLFQPFFRADKSRTRKTGGLGLGLPLAQRIAEAHAGTASITSTSQGTTASLDLPLASTGSAKP